MQRAMKWFLGFCVSIAILCGGFIILHGSLPPASVNAWLPAGNLTAARTGAASVLLQDGRLLITGGNGASGALASTDILDTSNGFTAGPPMSLARSNHVAVLLQDGRVLVAGGTGADGRASQSAELFDPASNSWSAAGPLMVGRSGATATLLASGQVLVAGGSANGAALASLELFDPNSNTFSLVSGTLSSPRENHAAALLPDGRVLIAGGWDGTTLAPVPPATTGGPNVLASTDIFDPTTGAVAPGPALSSPRMNFTATAALDGSVVAIGGTDGQNDLASIGVLASGAGAFVLSGAQLTTARQGHQAFLLPHNGNILVVGGTSSGVSVSSAELYTPWTGATSVTGAMASARSGATGSALSQMVLTAPVGIEGSLLVAGGVDASTPPATLQSAELYGFPWIRTDAIDYAPGTPVYVSGAGWQPGETLNITLVESPFYDTHGPYTVTVGPDGTFADQPMTSQDASCGTDGTPCTFAPDVHDIDVHFSLTAVGSASQTQTTFTDSTATNTTITSNHNPSTTGQSVTFTATVRNGSTQGSGTLVNSVGTVTFGTGGNSTCSSGFVAFSGGTNVPVNSSGQANVSNTFSSATTGITVRACYNGTGGSGTQNSNDSLTQVVIGPIDHLAVSGYPSPTTAGAPHNFTVTAQDAANNTLTAYTGTVHFTSSDGAAVLPADYPFVAGDHGTHNFSATLKTAGTQSITATDTVTSSITGTQSPITVQASSASKLVFTVEPGGAVAGSLLSPQPQISVEDAYGNVVTTGSGSGASITLSLTGGTAGAVLTCTGGLTHSATNGVLTLSGCSVDKAGTGYGIHAVVTSPFSASADSSPAFDITSANVATTLTLDAPSPASVSLGSSGPVTFTAHLTRTSGGAAVSGATINFSVDGTDIGTTAVTDGSGTATLSTYNPSALISGSHNVQASFTAATISTVSYSSSTSGTQTLTVTVPTTLTLATPSPASVSLGSTGPVTLSATLTRTSGGTPVSGATITFKVDGNSVGTAVTNVSGIATLSTYNPSALSAGSHNVQASFAQATISSTTYEASDSSPQTLTVTVPTTLVLSAPSPASVSYGNTGPVSLSATLTQTSGGTPISGATITFKVDGASVGTQTTGGTGVATLSYDPSSLGVGDHTIIASFAGQTISSITYEAKDSNTETLTITIATTLTLDAPSPASVSVGTAGPVTFTAHLKRNDTNAAVGSATITFKVDGGSVGTGTTDVSGTATLSTYNPSLLAAGSHTVQAFFAGQTISSITYESSTSTQQSLNVTVPTTLVLAAPSPASVSWGTHGPVSLSATLTRNDTTGVVAGATITFKVDGTSVGSPTTNLSGVATYSYDPSTLAAGDHTVQAFFAGQTISTITFEASTSGSQTLTITVPTTLALAAPSPASISVGSAGPVSFSATLTRNDTSATLSGQTVDFKVDGASVGMVTTNGSGVATLSTYNPSALTPGIHNVTAAYAGATVSGIVFEGSNSGTQTLNITVPTTLVLNSVTPSTVVWGTTGPVSFSATLTRNDIHTAVAGATVNFTVDGNAAGSAVTDASGVATVTNYNPSALSAGNHNVQASFGPQAISGITFEYSTSGTLTLTVTVPTTLTLAAPSPSSVVLGSPGPVTFSATLTRNDTHAAVAGATVNFTVDGNAAGSAVTDASGVATMTTYNPSALIIGSHNVLASFAGATLGGITFLSSTSTTQTLSVMYASGGVCDGDLGHSILQPVNADGSSVFKQTSTVPAKFRVCDYNSNSIGTPGVVSSFRLVKVVSGTIVNTVDEAVDSTTPDTMFRWDPSGQQWIFNISTKYAPVNIKNQTYYFTISLNDGSTITFFFGLK